MPRERKQPQRLEAGPATAAWSSKDARAPRGRKTQQVAKARPLAASAAGAAATTAASPARADGPRGPGRLKTALPAGTTIPALGDSVEVEFGDRQKYVGTVTGVKKSCFTVHFPCDGTDSDLVPMKHAYRVLSRAGQKRNRALDLEDGAAASPAPSRPWRDEQQAGVAHEEEAAVEQERFGIEYVPPKKKEVAPVEDEDPIEAIKRTARFLLISSRASIAIKNERAERFGVAYEPP